MYFIFAYYYFPVDFVVTEVNTKLLLTQTAVVQELNTYAFTV